jgi:hypothetical protein
MGGCFFLLEVLLEGLDIVVAFFDNAGHQESLLEKAVKHHRVLLCPVAQCLESFENNFTKLL